MKISNPTAQEMLELTKHFPDETSFTKTKHQSANPTAPEMRQWNFYWCRQTLSTLYTLYTKQEHQSKNPTALEMRWWNTDCPGQTPYTKHQHQSANPITSEMVLWNNDCPNQTPYTEEEL